MTGVTEVQLLYFMLAATVYTTVQTGKAQKREAKNKAAAEAMDATTRELARRNKMARYLATQNVLAGAGGISNVGSFAHSQEVAIRQGELGVGLEKAGSAARIAAYKAQGKHAMRQSLVSAGGEVAETRFEHLQL